MPYTSKTAMEPELAILMANLANINDHSIVLDPYCGSCQLLIASALQGVTTNIGVDVTIDNDKINSNFAYMNLQNPILYQALSESFMYENTREVSAIITDPPYAMSEDIHSSNDEIIVTRDNVYNDKDANLYTNKVIQNLLLLASKCLISKGRLVFFLPFRQKSNTNVNALTILSSSLPSDLRFLFSMKQILSPTFTRYLVVIEKK